jgi:hypothetical protein
MLSIVEQVPQPPRIKMQPANIVLAKIKRCSFVRTFIFN